ncbi:MAG: protein kinase domain-containing protein, partial [Persicimonas sp.]
MGEVWYGEHHRTGEPVAVKVIGRTLTTSSAHKHAFEREVRMMARLDHPGVVQILDYGRVSEAEASASQGDFTAQSPWLAMQFAAGGSLERLAQLMDWKALRAILVSVLDALAHSHAHGLVHRDIKPANILLDPTRQGYRVLLSDFGLAHAITRSRAQALSDGDGDEQVRSGTPYYMAPEQVRGHWRDFGPWTDLYALGCVAYELACGRPPFESRNTTGLWLRHLDEPPPPLEPRFAVPDGFEEWLEVLLTKDPRGRFQSAADAAWNLLLLDDNALVQPAASAGDAHHARNDASLATAETKSHIGIDEVLEVDPSLADTRVDRAGEDRIGAEHDQVMENRTALESMLAPEDRPVGLWEDSSIVDAGAAGGRSDADDADALIPRVLSLTDHVDLPDYDRPGFPNDWQAKARAAADSKRHAASVGLFGLRRLSMVGRHAERDTLWDELGRVFRQRCTRGVLISGEAGVGKSHLLGWFIQRAQELGLAKVLRISHQESSRGGDELRRALGDHLRTWDLSRSKVHRRLEKHFRGRLHLDDSKVARVIEEVDIPALTEFMRPSLAKGKDRAQFRFSDPTQRLAVLTRFLSLEAAERPLILWLDTVDSHSESLQLARYLLREDSTDPLGCLVLITTARGQLAATSDPHIRELLELKNLRRLDLAPLSDAEQRELVAQMLELSPELADRLVEHTQGVPLFAANLVRYWLECGLLDKRDDGYRLRSEGPRAFPEDIQSLWMRRLDRHLDALDPAAAADALTALELAAALGTAADRAEWERVVELLGLEPPELLWDELGRHGLAVSTPTGWRFKTESLRETLEQRARDAGLWKHFHAACARMLAEQPDNIARSRRRAQHLLLAEEYHRALSPLLDSGREHLRASSFAAARATLDQYRQVVDKLELPETDPRRAADMPLQADISRIIGQPERARSWAHRFFEEVAHFDDPAGLATISYVLGELDRLDGNVERGAHFYDHASYLFEEVGDIEGQVKALGGQGWLRFLAGQLDRGEALLDEAIELGGPAPSNGVREELSWCHQGRAEIAWFRGDFDAAGTLTRHAHQLAHSTGMPVYMGMARRLIADLAAERGDADEAWQIYRDALDLFGAVDSRLTDLARAGAAITAVADDRLQRAQALLEPMRAVVDLDGRYVYHLVYHSARLPLLAK